MLSPVVLPLPLVLAVIAALGFAAYAYRRWLESIPNPWEGQAWATPPAGGRHRLGASAAPYRDWATIAAERMNEDVRRRYASVVIAGLDTWDDDTCDLRVTLEPVEDDTVVLSPVS